MILLFTIAKHIWNSYNLIYWVNIYAHNRNFCILFVVIRRHFECFDVLLADYYLHVFNYCFFIQL